jgi:hypothetical protein
MDAPWILKKGLNAPLYNEKQDSLLLAKHNVNICELTNGITSIEKVGM